MAADRGPRLPPHRDLRRDGPHRAQGRWYRIALVWDGQHAALYVDGRVDAGRKLQFLDQETEPLRFGGDRAGAAPLRGLLDEIEVYERALTPTEVAGR